MSHQKQRPEKDCLNCSALVQGRYCQQCGQENLQPHMSFPDLIRHFIFDLFHFDGKFFDTLKYLITRPGYVPREYVMGKRMSFLDPIRMYLFTSALFFLVFFSKMSPGASSNKGLDSDTWLTMQQRYSYATGLSTAIRNGNSDSTLSRQVGYLLDTGYNVSLEESLFQPHDSAFRITHEGRPYMMVAEKKEVTRNETGTAWLDRTIDSRMAAYKRKYGDDKQAFINDLVHKFPYMLFVSLPFFAGILKLLYIRRKRFFYFDHAVFTLYQYIFTFILLLFFFLLRWLSDATGVGIFRTIGSLTFLFGGVYLYLGMKRFYEQGKGKTFVKFMLLNFLAITVMILLTVFFFFISVFQI